MWGGMGKRSRKEGKTRPLLFRLSDKYYLCAWGSSRRLVWMGEDHKCTGDPSFRFSFLSNLSGTNETKKKRKKRSFGRGEGTGATAAVAEGDLEVDAMTRESSRLPSSFPYHFQVLFGLAISCKDIERLCLVSVCVAEDMIYFLWHSRQEFGDPRGKGEKDDGRWLARVQAKCHLRQTTVFCTLQHLHAR